MVNIFPRWGGGWILNEVRAVLGADIDLALFSFKRPSGDVVAQAGMREWIGRTTYLPRGTSGTCLAAGLSWLLSSPRSFFRAVRAAWRLGGRMRRGTHILEIFHLATSIRRSGARHVHAQHADYLADAAMAAAECLGLPFSFSGHAHDLYTNSGRLMEKIRKASFVTTCTAFNERYLKEMCATKGGPGFESSKIIRVYHGVDLERFGYSRATGPGERLITVTRLKEKKGFPYLLDALAQLKSGGTEFTLDVYGDGDQKESIEARVEDLGLGDRVTLRGAIEHDRIPEALKQSGIFVLPCVVLPDQDRDGIPNTIIEALSCGVPVVSTAISGIPEVIRDGDSGLLVPERDAGALAEALRRLIADEDLRKRCGEQGRRVVESAFSLAATGTALAGLFRKAAGREDSAR